MKQFLPSPEVIQAIENGQHDDVFAILGAHRVKKKACIRVFQPHAVKATIILKGSGKTIAMQQVEKTGLFIADTGTLVKNGYLVKFENAQDSWETEDPYNFLPVISETDNYLLTQGERQKSYQILGANLINHYGVDGVHFAVWAPDAKRVSVVGDFNGWDGRLHVMRRHSDSGIWEIFIPQLTDGEFYKYEIISQSGEILPLKSDPYAFYCQCPPENSSIVWQKNNFKWKDKKWLKSRGKKQQHDAPMSIYEVHLGSWKRSSDAPNSYLSYRDLAHQLVEYLTDLNYTHIQILPIAEYPYDGSWGYQTVNLYAPTSRFGNPDELKYLIDYCHKHSIGVIIDWVPAHFPTDAHGLAQFDGTHLYDHADPRQGFHQDWNTCIYNYGRNEVCNFLIDSACFWLDEYHVDGLRVDAVASMLYLDYSRKEGEWIPNKYGGNENLEAIAFIQKFNETVYREFPGIVTIAEESTSWPGVTAMTSDGGLGFGYKWNMGWMHDTLNYMSKDAIHRKHHHHDMTFGTLYASSENFVLPISHDEVVHGKGSLINKMPGDYWQKFANLRAYFAFMWTYPGKKLLFMGNEFAQTKEWNHDTSLDWHLLDKDRHKNLLQLVSDLNELYTTTPALHQLDSDKEGFNWVDADNADESIYAYTRHAKNGDQRLIVCNFTPIVRTEYRFGVTKAGTYKEILNTDSQFYGGSNVGNLSSISTDEIEYHGQPNSLSVTLPGLSVCIFYIK